MKENQKSNQSISTVYSCQFNTWRESVAVLLEKSGLGEKAKRYETVVIKPNLVEILAPPITTPVELVEQIALYLLNYIDADQIVIGEGCGAPSYDTMHAFSELGYTAVAGKLNIKLVDLNTAELRHMENRDFTRWPKMYLPRLLDEALLISVPQLKAHSLSGVTLTMKNMLGCAPPVHFQGSGPWNKSSFHANIQEAIFDLNRYRTPDFTVLDASIGMAKAHLWGPQCSPPVGKLVAASDPVALDSYGCDLLGRSWRDIGHIAMANGVLGNAENYDLVMID